MRNNFFIAVILSFGIIGAANLHCKDRNCPDYLRYDLPVSLTPQIDTFQLGDILSLAIHFPKELIDERGGIANTFENFDFRFEIRSTRFDVPEENTSQMFDLVSEAGSDTVLAFNSFDVLRFKPLYDGFSYTYRGSLVLKKAGTFVIYIGCYNDDRFDPLEINGACDHLPLYIHCITNNGENNNIELVKPYFGGNPANWDNDFKMSGGFALIVR